MVVQRRGLIGLHEGEVWCLTDGVQTHCFGSGALIWIVLYFFSDHVEHQSKFSHCSNKNSRNEGIEGNEGNECD